MIHLTRNVIPGLWFQLQIRREMVSCPPIASCLHALDLIEATLRFVSADHRLIALGGVPRLKNVTNARSKLSS